MKIVAGTFGSGKNCYVQVKDLLCFGKRFNETLFYDYYKSVKEMGLEDKEFIHVSDVKLASWILLDNEVIDFLNYYKMPSCLIYGDILTKFSGASDIGGKELIKNAIADLKDIIAYKKGNLEYSIPPIPTGQYVMEGKEFVFSSTIFDNLFILRTNNGEDVRHLEFSNFLLQCLKFIFEDSYPAYLPNELDYTLTLYNNSLLIKVSPKVKKSFIERYRAKKEHNNGDNIESFRF